MFSGAVLSVASVGIENENGTVFEGDLDRLAGFGALVEQVETRLRIVVWDPFADGLPGRFDGLEGLDVEGRVGWWRDVDDALPKTVEAEEIGLRRGGRQAFQMEPLPPNPRPGTGAWHLSG